MSEPDFKGIEKVRVGKVGLLQTTINLDAHYFNPNHSKFRLKNASGDVWIDSIFLGHFVVDTLTRIPANSDFRVPVKLAADMPFFLKNDIKAMLNKDVWVKIEGRANVAKSLFSKHIDIHYEGKQNLGEFLKGMPVLKF